MINRKILTILIKKITNFSTVENLANKRKLYEPAINHFELYYILDIIVEKSKDYFQ